MIYTKKMQAAVKGIKAPNDFVLDIVEFDTYPPFIALRFYEKQWRYFSEDERIRCLEYLQKVKAVIELNGVKVTLDPVIGR